MTGRAFRRRIGFTIIEIVIVIAVGLGLMAGALMYLNTVTIRAEGLNYIREFNALMAQVRIDHKYGTSRQDLHSVEYPYSGVSLSATMALLNWEYTTNHTYLTPSGIPVRFDWSTYGGIGAQQIHITINAGKNLCRFLISDPENLYRSLGDGHNLRTLQIVTPGGPTTSIFNVASNHFRVTDGAYDLCEDNSLVRIKFDPFNYNSKSWTYE